MSLLASFLALAIASTPLPAPDAERVMLCYLASVDPSQPDALKPIGAFRLIAFRFPDAGQASIDGTTVVIHDPTNVLMGRPIARIAADREKKGWGIVTKGSPDDGLGLVVMPPEDGTQNSSAALIRTEKGKDSFLLTGACGLISAGDPADTFDQIKQLPDTRT